MIQPTVRVYLIADIEDDVIVEINERPAPELDDERRRQRNRGGRQHR